jgi:hypothetical protein
MQNKVAMLVYGFFVVVAVVFSAGGAFLRDHQPRADHTHPLQVE